MVKTLMFDPPSGWQYGFPIPIRIIDLQNLEEILLEHSYPKDLIPLAKKYSRFWEVKIESSH